MVFSNQGKAEANSALRPPSVKSNVREFPKKPKVLVADDERVIADTLTMILNQSGFREARAAYSGEKAVEMAPTFAPDMLISDVIMADLNGIDAAIQVRALLPSIKILLSLRHAASQPTCSRRLVLKATSSRSSPNPFIPRTCSTSCASNSSST